MIYCSVKYCCSNNSIPGVILHSILKSIKTPNHPAYHWSTLWPLEVWVRRLYNSWGFCAHKLFMFIYLHIKIQWNILIIENYYVNYQNLQNLMLLSSSDTKRTLIIIILVYRHRPERTGFNMYAEYTQLQLTFLAL